MNELELEDTLLMALRFHLTWSHSLEVSRFCNRLDHVGILLLMWGACIASIQFGFACDWSLKLTYWSTVSECLALREDKMAR